MIKNFCIGLLLFAAMQATTLRAASTVEPDGCLMNAGAYTFALNNVSNSVQSSSIDLDGYIGFFVSVTTNGNPAEIVPNVQVLWNNVTYTAYRLGETLPPGDYCVRREARYAKLQVAGKKADTTTKLTAAYALGSSPSIAVTLGQTMTVAGTVTANQGGGTWAVSVTAGPVYGAVSDRAYTVLTGTVTSIQLRAYTGVTANCEVLIAGNFGANSAIRYVIIDRATAPTDLAIRGNYLGMTATSQMLGTFSTDYWLHMQAVGTGPTGNDVTPYVYRKVTSTSLP